MPSAVRVETHHDFAVLERRLGALLSGLKAADGPLAPALVVAPTRRLLAHLQATLAAAFPALLGVRFQHHDALAAAIAEAAGPEPLRPLGDAARQAILADRIARAGGPLAAYVDAVPGGVGSILATLDELREAGVDPAAARAIAGLSSAARTLLTLYADYAAAIDALRDAGYADRAGRIAPLLAHAPRYAARFRLVVHYGAYDLVGMNLDLMQALGAGDAGAPPIVYLAPGHPTAPAFAWAREFWKTYLGVEPTSPPDDAAAGATPGGRLLGDALPLLYDEAARGTDRDNVAFFNTQGSADEMAEGILAAIAVPAGSTDPASIAIVARSLEPYAAAIGAVAAQNGVPLTTSASLPLARETAAQAATRLLRCLLLDMPAVALFDLIRSGRLRPPAGRHPERDVDAWERLTREWQVAGGRESLAERLPAWIEAAEPVLPEPADEEARERAGRRKQALLALARRLRDLVLALEREARPLRSARDWRAFGAAVRRVLATRVVGFETETAADADPAVGAILAALDELDAVAVAGVRFETPAAALARLEQGIAATTLPIGSVRPDGTRAAADAGGIRILDLMQARGLAFDTVVLVGTNAGLLPRPARVDPFLPDPDRERLRRALGRPLTIKEDALAEEHLLLALALGSARRRLLVAWQRADDDGRARSPSLALREIARLTRGAPELEPIDREARRVSADPLARARGALETHRLLPAAEAGPALALLAGSPDRLRRHLDAVGAAPDLLPGLDAGLDFLSAIESEDRTTFDALPGGEAPTGPWSPSRLETLGACPQQYFFRHRLGIDEWNDPDTPDAVDRRELGSLAHAVLADLYRTPPAGPLEARVAELWRRHAGPIAARLDALYPGLFEVESAAWIAALAGFAARDRKELGARAGALEVERSIDATLALPGFGDLAVRGRVDRLVRDDTGTTVGDYKTGGRPSMLVDPATLLKGRRLQMAVYALLAGSAAEPGRVAVEVLGVGPGFDPDDPAARARLDPEALDRFRPGLVETIAVLARLAGANLFPLDPESGRCDRCVYRRACRRTHPATLDRLERHAALAEFHRLRLKVQRKPLLADLEADADGEEA